MSAEFSVTFDDAAWYATHRDALTCTLAQLVTFSERVGQREFRLIGREPRNTGDWCYDARVFLDEERILLEISAHPASIERDLALLLEWIRRHTRIAVIDEEGVPSNW